MKIKIRALRPIHIGSGAEVVPNEYLVEGGLLHRIDMNSLVADPEFAPLMEKFIASAVAQRYLGTLLPVDLLKKHTLYSLPLAGNAQKHLATNQIAIKGHIKTAGRVYLPGSSVKGSLLSPLIWKALFELGDAGKFNLDQYTKARPDYDGLLAQALGFISQGPPNKFVRWADITDSQPLPAGVALDVRMAEVVGSKKGGHLPIMFECIRPGTEFIIEIKPQQCRYEVEEILETADEYFRFVAKDDDSGQVETDKYLLRLGQGATCYSTSLIYLSEALSQKYDLVHDPITRKLIDRKTPLGWAEAEII